MEPIRKLPGETRREYKTRWERERYNADPTYRHSVVTRVVEGDGDPRHGRPSTYTNHGCRCPKCRKAFNEKYHAKKG